MTNIPIKFNESNNLDVKFKSGSNNIKLKDMYSAYYQIYDGDYIVTPTQYEQVLYTNNKLMKGNVIVEPIPWYYGLISYDDECVITVS